MAEASVWKDEHLQRVLPHLFIGDIVSAQRTDLLSAVNITRILDLSNTFPVKGKQCVLITEGLEPPVLSRLEVPVDDMHSEDISLVYDSCHAFIESCRLRGETVLVHCFEVNWLC